MRQLLEEIQNGTRTIAGTEWPVLDQLHRTGEREWTVTRELCNGAARGAETYRSESAAREAFERRVTGPKPRSGKVATTRLELRLTEDERSRWQAAADRREVSLAQLIRDSVERALS